LAAFDAGACAVAMAAVMANTAVITASFLDVLFINPPALNTQFVRHRIRG
jgi:hypothetical protein